MIWLRIITNLILSAIIVWQVFLIRRLRQRNAELQFKLFETLAQHVSEMANLSRHLVVRNQDRHIGPTGDPQISLVSKTTQNVMKRMWNDPSFNMSPQTSYFPMVKPPSGMGQPQIRDVCKNCGLPILKGDHYIGTPWRDHIGRRACDGVISGTKLSDHIPSKGDQ